MSENTNTSAVTVWNDALAAELRAVVLAGESVGAAMVKIAPKGFLGKLRAERKAELMKNSANILGQFTDNGYKVAKAGRVKELKDGRKQVEIMLEFKPTRTLTAAEMAETFGVEDDVAAAMMKAVADLKAAKAVEQAKVDAAAKALGAS